VTFRDGTMAARAGTAAWAQGRIELVFYSALEPNQIKACKEAFEKDNAAIELEFVLDSTGIVTAKVLAGKAKPQADVV
jgi:iron(III) transport system substrate-binding protein